MNQSGIDYSGAFPSHDEASVVLQPCVGALDNPATSVSPKLAAVLMRSSPVVFSFWNDRINPSTGQHRPNRVRVVASVGDQALGRSAFDCVQGRLQQFHFRRRRRVHVKSERSTLAINQYHKLRSFPAFCLAHFEPPFLAEANVPSTKHSSQRTCCCSESWAKKACQTFSKVPSLAHRCNRRCTVLDAPKRSGNSLQGAPVLRIQSTPSKHFRSSNSGRPPTRSFLRHGFLRTGRCGLILSHCSSVSPFQAIVFMRPPFHKHNHRNYLNISPEVMG
jgi:hypothetical protein